MQEIKKQQKGGIVFFQTKILPQLNQFYINEVGCTLWLDQGGCQLFQFGNMIFGFCGRDKVDDMGMVTFFYSSREEVDEMYKKLKHIAVAEPKDNPQYRIYHFYAEDPEGRNIEFQYFWEN